MTKYVKVRKLNLITIILVALLQLFLVTNHAVELDAAGSEYTTTFRIDHYLIDEELINFPVTVTLDENNFDFSLLADQTNGTDLHFQDENGSEFLFERDYIDVASSKAVFHVLVPTISHTIDTEINILYGDVNYLGSESNVSRDYTGKPLAYTSNATLTTNSGLDKVLTVTNDTDGFVTVTDPLNELNVGTGDFTIELSAVANSALTAENSSPRLFANASTSYLNGEFGIEYDRGNSNKYSFELQIDNTRFDINSDNSYVDDEYHDIAIVRNNGQISMYVDGVKQTTIINASGALDLSVGGTFTIGGTTGNNAAQQYAGSIGYVKVSNSAVYTSNYPPTWIVVNDSNTLFATNFDTVWDDSYTMVQHMGDSLIDSTGNGNNGTNSGTTVISSNLGTARLFSGAEYIEVEPTAIPAGTEITGTFLTKGDIDSLPANTNLFWAANNDGRVFSTHVPFIDETVYGSVYFDAGSGADDTFDSYDRIFQPATPSEYEGNYRTWSFSKNSDVGNMNIYLDATSWLSDSSKYQAIGTADIFSIGAAIVKNQTDSTINYYHGLIDEIRISKIERSAAWIKAESLSLSSSLLLKDLEYTKEFQIDSSLVDGELTNFPVTVYLDDKNFEFTRVAHSDGSDIHFIDDSGNELLYEKEIFDASTQKAVYHVLLPTVSSTTNTTFLMRYGDVNQLSNESNANRDYTGKTLTFSTGANLTTVSDMNKALELNTIDGSEYIVIDDITSNMDISTSDFTIEWRENVASTNPGVRLSTGYSKDGEDNSSNSIYGGFLLGYGNTLHVSSSAYIDSDSLDWDLEQNTPAITVDDNDLNTWVSRSFVREGNNWRTYKNGVLDSSGTFKLSSPIGFSTDMNWSIGNWREKPGDVQQDFNGLIDNFKITVGTALYSDTYIPTDSVSYDSAEVVFATNFDTVWDENYTTVLHMEQDGQTMIENTGTTEPILSQNLATNDSSIGHDVWFQVKTSGDTSDAAFIQLDASKFDGLTDFTILNGLKPSFGTDNDIYSILSVSNATTDNELLYVIQNSTKNYWLDSYKGIGNSTFTTKNNNTEFTYPVLKSTGTNTISSIVDDTVSSLELTIKLLSANYALLGVDNDSIEGIGLGENWYIQEYIGSMSEFRLSDISRSDAWVQAEQASLSGTLFVDTPSIETSQHNFSFESSTTPVAVASDINIFSNEPITTAKVVISNGFVSGSDTLTSSYSGTGSLSFDSNTGVMTLTGFVNNNDLETAIESIEFGTTSTDNSTRTIDITIGSAISFEVNESPHYYEYYSDELTWTGAKDAAAAKTLYGMSGYLATVTSSGENEFIATKLNGNAWLGATDNIDLTPSSTYDYWYWVTGPEAGTFMGSGLSPNYTQATNQETNVYNNWNSGEPNGTDNVEMYLEIYVGSSNTWNDLNGNASSGVGYVVEYGGMPGESSPTLTVSNTIEMKTAISIAPNNGDSNSTNYYFVGDVITTLPTTYTKTGYSLSWDMLPYTVTGTDDTLTATWTANQYTVTLNHNGGSVGGSTTSINTLVTYDSAMPTVTLPTYDGKIFNGYIDSSNNYYYQTSSDGSSLLSASNWNHTSDTTLTADWVDLTATATATPAVANSSDSVQVTLTIDDTYMDASNAPKVIYRVGDTSFDLSSTAMTKSATDTWVATLSGITSDGALNLKFIDIIDQNKISHDVVVEEVNAIDNTAPSYDTTYTNFVIQTSTSESKLITFMKEYITDLYTTTVNILTTINYSEIVYGKLVNIEVFDTAGNVTSQTISLNIVDTEELKLQKFIVPSNGTAYTDYLLRIDLNQANSSYFLTGDYLDLYFMDQSGTELDADVITYTAGSTASFLVTVPSVSASTDTVLYLVSGTHNKTFGNATNVDGINNTVTATFRKLNTTTAINSQANESEMNSAFASTATFADNYEGQVLTNISNGLYFNNAVPLPSGGTTDCDYCGFYATGYIYAPETGTYSFGLKTDDASYLKVNGTMVATDYGLHGTPATWVNELGSTIMLNEGYYTFEYLVLEKGGGFASNIGWNIPSSSSMVSIPTSNFYSTLPISYSTSSTLSATLDGTVAYRDYTLKQIEMDLNSSNTITSSDVSLSGTYQEGSNTVQEVTVSYDTTVENFVIKNVDKPCDTIKNAYILDVDSDGLPDGVRVEFMKSVIDSTIISSEFSISTFSGLAYSSTGTANDAVVYFTFDQPNSISSTDVDETFAYNGTSLQSSASETMPICSTSTRDELPAHVISDTIASSYVNQSSFVKVTTLFSEDLSVAPTITYTVPSTSTTVTNAMSYLNGEYYFYISGDSGTGTITYSIDNIVDVYGNTSSKYDSTNSITLDNVNPTISYSRTVETTIGTSVSSTYTVPVATFTDNLSGIHDHDKYVLVVDETGTLLTTSAAIQSTIEAGKNFTITYHVIDLAGNEVNDVYNVVVSDDEYPVISNTNQSVSLKDEVGSFTVSAISATDNLDITSTSVVSKNGDDTILNSVDSIRSTLSSGGNVYVTYTATDTSGNVTTKTVTITPVDDIAPTFDTIQSQVIEAGTSNIDWTSYVNNLSDNISSVGNITLTETDTISNYHTLGTYTNKVTATDEYGTSYVQEFSVEIVDTQGPVIEGYAVYSYKVFDVNTVGDYSTGVLANDLNDGGVTPTITSDVNWNKIGVYHVTYSASDTHGNSSMTTILIYVVDPTKSHTILADPSAITVDEQTAITLDENVSVTGPSADFSNGTIIIDSTVNDPNTRFSLMTVEDPTAAGVISIDAGAVYIGTGTSKSRVGTVDSTLNGENGNALKITLSAPMTNGDFSNGWDGWTVTTAYTPIGTDSWNSSTTISSVTSSVENGYAEFYIRGTAYHKIDPDTGNYISGSDGYGTIHGPKLESSYFSASPGDVISFEWKADAAGDDYDVYAFLVNDDTDEVTEILWSRGSTASWQQKTIILTTDILSESSDKLKFVFYNGSFDRTGGYALGAKFYIDDVRVVTAAANSAVVEGILKLIQFEYLSDDPSITSLDIQVTTTEQSGFSQTGTRTVNISSVNDTMKAKTGSTFNKSTDDNTSITFDVTDQLYDPEGDATTYSIVSGSDFATVSGSEITIVPTDALVGTQTVTVKATDTNVSTVYSTFDYSVTISNNNDTPTVNSSVSTTLTGGDTLSTYSLQLPDNYFLDEDFNLPSSTEAITYSVSGLPTGLSFDAATRTISGTPVSSDSTHDYTVVLKGTDNSNAYQTVNLTLTITGDRTISFDEKGGSTISDINQVVGSTLVKPSNPSRIGYEFDDWYTDNTTFNDKYTFDVMPSSNVTLYAKWTPVTYSISYELNDGTQASSPYTTYDIESSSFTLEIPTKAGYSFMGWYDSNTAGTKYETITTGSIGDLNLYARWYQVPTVTASSSDKLLFGEGNIVIDDAITFQTDFAITTFKVSIENGKTGDTLSGTGCTFEQSTFDLVCTVSDKSEIQTAMRSIKFDTDSTDVTDRKIVFSVGDLVAGTNGHIYEYVSSGTSWTNAITLAESKTYYNLQGYLATITSAEENALIATKINADIWLGATDNTFYTTQYGSTGYDQWYWVTGPEAGTYMGSGVSTNYVAASGVYQNWSPYSGGMEPNGTGSGEMYAQYYSGTTKWNDLSNSHNLGYVVEYSGTTEELSYYTASRTIQMNVITTFKFGNGSSDEILYQTPGETLGLGTLPSKDGYVFDGWKELTNNTLVSDAGVVKDGKTVPYVNTTYEAQWTPVTYSITYELDGGTNSSSNPSEYTIESDDIEYANPSKTGYTFDGWFTDLKGSESASIVTSIPQGTWVNKTVYAHWTPIVYSITYVDASGLPSTAVSTYTIESETISFERALSKTGYSFVGWYSDSTHQTPYNAIYQGTIENITVYAKWSANSYDVIFKGMDSEISRTKVTYGGSVSNAMIEGPELEGYTFVGWKETVPSSMPARSITFTAEYEPNTYKILVKDTNGEDLETIEQVYLTDLSSVNLPTPEVEEGYEFAGWDMELPDQMPANDLEIKALVAPLLYKVEYLDYDDQIVYELEVPYQEVINAAPPTTLIREGYIFVSWEGELPSAMPHETVTMHAVYKEAEVIIINGEIIMYDPNREYSITFDSAGGTNVASIYGNFQDEISLSTPSRTGYTFSGWYADGVEFDDTTMPAKELILVAQWTPNVVSTTVTVSGTVYRFEVHLGLPIGSLPEPILEGYTFVGWQNGQTKTMITDQTIIQSLKDVTFIPLFEKQTSNSESTVDIFTKFEAVESQINDYTNKTDNITSTSLYNPNYATVVEETTTQDGSKVLFTEEGQQLLEVPGMKTPLALNSEELEYDSIQVFYTLSKEPLEQDSDSWIAYRGQSFLSNEKGMNVYMLIIDASGNSEVQYVKEATYLSVEKSLPITLDVTMKDTRNRSLDEDALHESKTVTTYQNMEYDGEDVTVLEFDTTKNQDLTELIVRYRADEAIPALFLQVNAANWQEIRLTQGQSSQLILPMGTELEVVTEYVYGSETLVEEFNIHKDVDGLSVIMDTEPDWFLRSVLILMVVGTLGYPVYYTLSERSKNVREMN